MNSKCFSRKDYLVLAIALTLSTQSAWAYLDPGTGTIILQGIVAGIVGGYMAIKMGWFRLRALLPGANKTTTSETTTTPETSSSTEEKK